MAFSPFLRFRLVWSSAFAWQHNNNLLCPKLNRGMKVNRSGAEHAKRPPRSGFVLVGHSEVGRFERKPIRPPNAPEVRIGEPTVPCRDHGVD